MAGARAATSISLTIGVAFVTVLIVGGILAGPAILDCAHQPSSFGACLRDRLDHSRLVPPKDEPSQTPVLSSESSPPALPELPSRQADVGHPDGWLDARANEYEPPATSALEPPALPPLPDLVAPAPLPMSMAPSSSAVAEIEIAPPPALPRQRPVTTGVAPKAEVKQPVTKPVRVAKIVPKPAPVLRPKAAPKPALKARPVRTFKNDPRYPNVTVLPPPATGSNSSFVTLKTH